MKHKRIFIVECGEEHDIKEAAAAAKRAEKEATVVMVATEEETATGVGNTNAIVALAQREENSNGSNSYKCGGSHPAAHWRRWTTTGLEGLALGRPPLFEEISSDA